MNLVNENNLIHLPDTLQAETDTSWVTLKPRGDFWEAEGITVLAVPEEGGLKLSLSSPDKGVRRILASWNTDCPGSPRILGDHWERGYGDLEWRGIVPQRIMPWYFIMNSGESSFAAGVKTGCSSMCFWQIDSQAVRLCLDVRCGKGAVELGARVLDMAVIVCRDSVEGESPYEASRRFCSLLCDRPVLPDFPVYGGNNWYYAYGKSCHSEILRDSQLISSLADNTQNRPFMVIDDGWQLDWKGDHQNGGPWDRGNRGFPDMERLSGEMKDKGVRPGIWFRPLKTTAEFPEGFRRHEDHGTILDPSRPEVLELVARDTQRIVDWGFEMIKHDFSSFDIFGTWGFQMGSSLLNDNYTFYDRTKTTAEIILALYRTIAEKAGPALVIGCNTVSHLAAGLFAIQRTGDDTSGRAWERTRLMGINTLSHRMIQHNNFYACDADCVGLTKRIPWELNRQWLELLSGSGTPLFVSADPLEIGETEKRAVREAFTRASSSLPPAEPLDWLDTTCPTRWNINGRVRSFNWFSEKPIGRDKDLVPESLFF